MGSLRSGDRDEPKRACCFAPGIGTSQSAPVASLRGSGQAKARLLLRSGDRDEPKRAVASLRGSGRAKARRLLRSGDRDEPKRAGCFAPGIGTSQSARLLRSGDRDELKRACCFAPGIGTSQSAPVASLRGEREGPAAPVASLRRSDMFIAAAYPIFYGSVGAACVELQRHMSLLSERDSFSILGAINISLLRSKNNACFLQVVFNS